MEIPDNFHWICPQVMYCLGWCYILTPCPAIVEGSFADSSLFFRRSCDYEIHKQEQTGGVLEMFKNGPYCRSFLRMFPKIGVVFPPKSSMD